MYLSPSARDIQRLRQSPAVKGTKQLEEMAKGETLLVQRLDFLQDSTRWQLQLLQKRSSPLPSSHIIGYCTLFSRIIYVY